MRHELTKLNRERRQLVRVEPAVASAFLAMRAEEDKQVREQQRMVRELNESEEAKRRSDKELKDLKNEIARHRKQLRDISAQVEDATASMITTPEYLGQGLKGAGGKVCADRRKAILQRIACIGYPLEPQQRNNFHWFQSEWDRINVEEHGKDWPWKFLEKLKGVLDEMKTRPTAFSKFLFDEERACFNYKPALLVPQSLKRLRSIEQ